MEKKAYAMVICVLLILTFTLNPASAQPKLPKYVRFASLTVGMSAYYVAVGIGSVMTKYSPIKVAVDPVGMHAAVFELIEKKEAEMGALGSLEVVPALRGEGIYKGKPKPILAGMTTIRMYNVMHTTPRSGIKKAEDLRGKRVMADLVPSPSTREFTDAFLKAHGMTRTDIKWMSYGTFTEAVAAIIEGGADAISHPSTIKGMQEIKLAVGYKAVPIEPGPAKKMLEMVLGCTYETMPKGYNGVVEEPTPTLAYYTIIFFRQDIPDEVVYTLVRAALENHKEYAGVHPLLPEVDAARAAKIVGAPFHPGAIKYYKEKGVWTSEHEKLNAELLTKYKR
jgi:TRAP transporter TAXI family solute receptor